MNDLKLAAEFIISMSEKSSMFSVKQLELRKYIGLTFSSNCLPHLWVETDLKIPQK